MSPAYGQGDPRYHREPAPAGGMEHHNLMPGAVMHVPEATRQASLAEVVDRVLSYAEDVGVETACLARAMGGFPEPDPATKAYTGEQLVMGQTARLVEATHILAASLTVLRRIKERM